MIRPVTPVLGRADTAQLPKEKALGSDVRRSLMRLVGGSLTGQLITILTMPIVTRLFNSEEVGRLGVFTAFLAIPSAFVCLRFDAAIFVSRRENEVDRLRSLCTIAMLATTLVSTAVFLVLSSRGSFGLGAVPVWSAAFLAAILAATGVSSVYRALLVRSQQYSPIGLSSATRGVVNSALRLAGGTLGGGLFALLFAELCSSLAVLRALRPGTVNHAHSKKLRLRARRLIATARQWKAFPIFESPSALVDQAIAAAPILVLANQAGPAAAGLYAIAYRVVALPSAHIGASIGEVFRGRCAALVRNGHQAAAKRLFFRLSACLLACALGCYIPLTLLAPRYFGMIFGAEWRGAGTLVPWLTLASGAALVTSPISSILQVLRCQHLKWIYDVASIVLLVCAVQAARSSDVQGTVAILSMAGAASSAIYYCVLLYSLRRI